ncbi:acyl carrier protein [Cupriavidus sp. MP-37]|uniref:acyl carrier protein n=1 Tax=Cupriavidus sp. MP-37 TaxID=2884455 RepID=UPI001D0AA1DD|nr:acyl carrier protein [Cupriavidus sp. MP-37]UDM48873.1 acyl carrier protein [Cupriavidus sp. MP-37]
MDYLQEARELLSGCLFVPVEKIDADASIHTLHDMDSLTFEMIVMEIEKRTMKEVDPVALLELRTVSDLAGLLESGR